MATIETNRRPTPPSGTREMRKVRNMKQRSILGLALVLVGFGLMGSNLVLAADAPAAEAGPAVHAPAPLFGDGGLKAVGAGIGAGLVVMGGAAGIGRIGGSAVESMARQPEAAGTINTAMLITAAMIEGATLFAVVVALLAIVL